MSFRLFIRPLILGVSLLSLGLGGGGMVVRAQDGSHTPRPATTATAPALTSGDQIWVITDPHYLSPELHDDGPAFARIQATAAGKDVRYTRERMQALVQQVQAERPALLIVSGDLTLNGERQSSLELADFFDQIEALGTPVLVEPGPGLGPAWPATGTIQPTKCRPKTSLTSLHGMATTRRSTGTRPPSATWPSPSTRYGCS